MSWCLFPLVSSDDANQHLLQQYDITKWEWKWNEGSDNLSVQMRQSNQTFVSPIRANVQMTRTGLNVSYVERKESGRRKRSRCKKVRRSPPFVLSFLLSRLANISFFTAPLFTKLQNVYFHFPPPTRPLLSL